MAMRIGFFLFAALVWSLPASAQDPDLPPPPGAADFPRHDEDRVSLGRALFFDPILSGNRNISCATCHHPTLGSGDGLSLGLGEGAEGLGTARRAMAATRPEQRIPRNAPALWNLGARDFTVLFHDGRVERDSEAPHGIRMPEGRALERPVSSVLAAQAMLPILSADEMAGQPGENPVADAIAADRIAGPEGAWALLAARVAAVPSYRAAFDWLGVEQPLHMTDIAETLAAFIAHEFRATDSPFDRHLRGEAGALDPAQTRGMALFYGKAACADCHAGPFQTDHRFYAIGLPQFGPGKDEAQGTYADRGRSAVTGRPEDDYRFRTPSLRNVTLNGPYDHNGAYRDLEAMVRHHLDPIRSLAQYDRAQAVLARLPGQTDD